MNPPHIAKAFDRDLGSLASSIGAMGDVAASQFVDAIRALLRADSALAQRVIDQDRQLDTLRTELSAKAALVIARRQPLAGDLDAVLADFRIVEDLERIGDLAKNIAKRAKAVESGLFPADVVQRLERLADLATAHLKAALESYVQQDADKALLAREGDEQIDEQYTLLFREIVARMSTDQTQVFSFVHLLFCAKNIERIGDHATHIAEAAYLTVKGHWPEPERQRLDLSSTMTDIDLGKEPL